jgi:hypothetical protein
MTQSDIVVQYAGAWAKTTEAEILSALSGCWTPESTYTDPLTDTVRGPAELARVIIGLHTRMPGAALTLTSGLDVHHGFGRFSWRLTLPAPVEVDGVTYSAVSDGFDFVEFTPDGTRILKIVGFFGPFPH